jgi:hypothetical protein
VQFSSPINTINIIYIKSYRLENEVGGWTELDNKLQNILHLTHCFFFTTSSSFFAAASQDFLASVTALTRSWLRFAVTSFMASSTKENEKNTLKQMHANE